MWRDCVSNPGPLALKLDALPTVLCDPKVGYMYFAVKHLYLAVI